MPCISQKKKEKKKLKERNFTPKNAEFATQSNIVLLKSFHFLKFKDFKMIHTLAFQAQT